MGETPVYSHNMVGTNDVAKSKTFYDAVFQAMAASPAFRTTRAA